MKITLNQAKVENNSEMEYKKASISDKIKGMFKKEKQEGMPDLWTGQTTVLDIISPSSVDNGSRDYIVVDGIYHAYLYCQCQSKNVGKRRRNFACF